MRIGFGFDARPFDTERPLRIAGVEVSSDGGLAGPAPSDPVVGSLVDALVGALALDGVGEARPEGPEQGEESGDPDPLELLAAAVREMEARNYQVVNVDLTVYAEGPDLGPQRGRIREALAERLHVDPRRISLKDRSLPARIELSDGDGLTAAAAVLVAQPPGAEERHASLRAGG